MSKTGEELIKPETDTRKIKETQASKQDTNSKKKKEKIILLRQTTLSFPKDSIEEKEKYYAEKFGHKVIILEDGLDLVKEYEE